MEKLLEIGEIGLLRDIPSELNFMTSENNLLRQNLNKVKLENKILVCSIVVLVIIIIWSEIKQSNEEVKS
jgi:hypothetical protein